MLKTIFLITPVYVTLFWSIVLNTNLRQQTAPRVFLSKFMTIAFVVYISHFLFYASLPRIYGFIDPFYQFASLLVFPVYHIYFRLLTVDPKFSFKKHWQYLLLPTLLFIMYCLGVLFSDKEEYQNWIFNRNLRAFSTPLIYLHVIHQIIRLVFILQVIITIIFNFKLINKYGYRAQQYYSDMEDSRITRVTILNTSMLITGVGSVILAVLGRDFFKNELTGIALASIIFSSMLFIIGWLGDQQRALNPTFDTDKKIDDEVRLFSELTNVSKLKIINKLNELFEDNKIFLDSKLNIVDVAALVGSNRTYISSLINQNFNQNFCSFVNHFRVNELEKNIIKYPLLTNQELAELCGFGSVESMKRAIFTKTGKSMQDWRNQIKVN